MMIKSQAKVSVDQTDHGTLISISPEISSIQQVLLGSWIVIWLFCGMFMLLSMLKGFNKDEQLFFMVFMAFWAYFLFYGVRSFVWNKVGVEHIEISKTQLDYKRAYNTYGKVVSYQIENIKNLGMVNYEDKTWAKVYNDAFWTIGGETVGFEYFGKKIAIGYKLEEKQVKALIKDLKSAIKN